MDFISVYSTYQFPTVSSLLFALLELRVALTAVFIAFAVTALAVIYDWVNSSTGPPLPPGPRDGWLFASSIPKTFSYRKFEEWTQEYGPIFSLKQGFNTVIVIGRVQATIDLMEKEGAALSDRPRSISGGETLSGGMRVMFTPLSERFKKMRKALHAQLQPSIASSYLPMMERNAKQHIIDLLENPDGHQDHAKRYAASTVMELSYGKRPQSFNDPDITAVNRCLTTLGMTLRPGVWKVDTFPFLRYIPGYLKELKEGHQVELNLFKSQVKTVQEKMHRGEDIPQSFSKYLLDRQKQLALSDDELAYLTGGIFGAGSDTTASAITIAVMAAACYPEAQAKVQEELDLVIGRDRAPTVADHENLPQLNAFILETFRWRPVSAGGFAHKATKDLIWKNYLIPKGAMVFGNIWGIGRDPEFFPDPESFNPQRWINEEGKIRNDLKSFSFGFGRRVCPGQHVATASVTLNTSLIFWAFKVKADPLSPIDQMAFTTSANAHPLPFKVFFEPRAANTSEGIRELIADYGV